MSSSPRRALTWTEVVIVVLLLGVLAAIVVPRYTDASDKSRDLSARTTLAYLRQQIDAFKVQHGQVPPQNGTLWAILQRTSDAAETATARPVGTRLGPYFHGDPMNPWNNLTRVSSAEVDSGAGWYYVATPGAYELRLRNGDGSINRQY